MQFLVSLPLFSEGELSECNLGAGESWCESYSAAGDCEMEGGSTTGTT